MPRILTLLMLALVTAASGCVYRPYIQQGNLLKVEDVDQVTVGMTRSQVRYLLGTPMISDPFHPDRWDYIFTFKWGRLRKVDRAHFVIYFADDKVTRVEKLDLPDDPLSRQRQAVADKKAQDKAAERSSTPPATTDQPRPESPAPPPGDG